MICPEPNGISATWLNFEPERKVKVVAFPHEEIILRWTAAIKEKGERLLGTPDGKEKGYLGKGIVGTEGAYVIAVNGCLELPRFHGQSVKLLG